MRVIAIGPMFNEGERAVGVVKRFPPGVVEEIVIVDDASTDGAARTIAETGVTVLSLDKRSGPGTAIRRGIEYGLKKKFDVFVVFATNGKDNPEEIQRLLEPVKNGSADFVQGSRYLKGGAWSNMPKHRVWGVPVFTFLFSLFTGRKITDATNGFRAIRAKLFEDPRINLWQSWLEGYPLETYLFLQAIRLGYRVVEVPITKTYPNSKTGYTKQRPWVDWWNYFKPIPYVVFGLKK
ncbi:MAG: glycosyltransferase family 2 protein [Candidatus Omnitrophica bacterium]|nr:glycosyltransferase family 2 protein [Candidatus Omnitrophota bacterium]